VSEIGPVQLVSLDFEPGANFEGRIADELAALVKAGTIRILDLLFIARDTESDELVVMEQKGADDMAGIAGALLGIEFGEGAEKAAAEHSFGFSRAEIDQMGAGLAPGGSAGLLLIEHVWARGLRNAVRDAGGRMSGQGFLTPESIAAADPDLAAMSDAVDEK
jgi:hypothetical protein